MSVGNVTINQGTNSAETVDSGNVIKTIDNMVNNNNAISSISYTKGSETVTIEGNELEELFKSIKMFAEDIKAGKIPQEAIKDLCGKCQGFLTALSALVNEVIQKMGLSNEETKEDIELKNTTDNLIDKLLNSKTFSDFDMRELMKLLIQAFSQLMNTQRAITLNTLNGILTALQEKIKQMEISRDENYKATMAQATAQLIGACLQMAVAIGSALTSGVTALGVGMSKPSGGASTGQLTGQQQIIANVGETVKALWSLLGNLAGIANPIGTMISAEHTYNAKTAEIASTVQDKLLEVLGKALDECSNQLKVLMDFINTLLKTIMEYIQNNYNTEMKIVG